MIEIDKIAIASLLHDIGKLRWRVFRQRKNHQDLGADWLDERGLGEIISGAARYHHGGRFGEIKNSNYFLVIWEKFFLESNYSWRDNFKGELYSQKL